MNNLVLRPNCLLTKYPLLFISGPRSIFYYRPLAEYAQYFLREHGYVVHSPVLPFRNTTLRKLALRRWLENQSDKKFHFFLTQSTLAELEESIGTSMRASITFLDTNENEELANSIKKIINFTPLQYQLHRIWCLFQGIITDPYWKSLQTDDQLFLDHILRHCIKLAEQDLSQDDRFKDSLVFF